MSVANQSTTAAPSFALTEDYWRQFGMLTLKLVAFPTVGVLLFLLDHFTGTTLLTRFVGPVLSLVSVGPAMVIAWHLTQYPGIIGETGQLSFGESGIDWMGRHVSWRSLASTEIAYDRVAGSHFNRTTWRHEYSLGFNAIRLETRAGEVFAGHFRINSWAQVATLKGLFLAWVLKHELEYDIARGLLQPEDYAAHQILKAKLVEGRNH